jgi:flagellar biosynthetic protein FliO
MNSTPDLMTTALQMVAALGIVLAGLFVLFYFMRRFLRKDAGGWKDPLIRVLANQYLGLKKNIALVEVPGAVLVIGISNERIALLTKIEDSAILSSLQSSRVQTAPSFSDHLQRLTDKLKRSRSHS